MLANPASTPLGNSHERRASALPIWRSLVVIGLITITLLACFSRGDIHKSSEAGVVMTLPEKVGSFTGEPQEITEAERTILPGDTELTRMLYRNPAGDEITQSIVLSGGEKRSIHRPEICLPGQGWTISGQQTIPIELESGRTLDVVNLTLSREVVLPTGQRRTIYGYFIYWFIGKNRTTASQMERFLVTAWDRLTENTNHRWAYIIVSGLITDAMKPGGKNAEETLQMAEDFIRQSVPYFQKSEMPDGRETSGSIPRQAGAI